MENEKNVFILEGHVLSRVMMTIGIFLF